MPGGLVSDITTAMVAMFAITFIVIGIDYLKDVFESHVRSVTSRRYAEKADCLYKDMKNFENFGQTDSADYDIARARYRNAVRRASQ